MVCDLRLLTGKRKRKRKRILFKFEFCVESELRPWYSTDVSRDKEVESYLPFFSNPNGTPMKRQCDNIWIVYFFLNTPEHHIFGSGRFMIFGYIGIYIEQWTFLAIEHFITNKLLVLFLPVVYMWWDVMCCEKSEFMFLNFIIYHILGIFIFQCCPMYLSFLRNIEMESWIEMEHNMILLLCLKHFQCLLKQLRCLLSSIHTSIPSYWQWINGSLTEHL